MNKTLKDFWEWSKTPPESYAEYGFDKNSGVFEDDFPLFDELCEYAKKLVDNNSLELIAINDLLEILAIDNESENVIEYIEENSSEDQLNLIIANGIIHRFYHTRWQIAELIFRRQPDNAKEKISELLIDNHSYVRKRAKNLIDLLK
jgi:hypothetical protein